MNDQVSLNVTGKLHRIYREKNGDVVVNHAGSKKQNGKYDKINLSDVAGVKSVKGGVKATTNWHKEHPHNISKSMVAPGVFKPASSLTKKERKQVLRGVKSHKNYSPKKPDYSKFRNDYEKGIAMTNSEGLSRLRKPDLEGSDFIKLRSNVYTRPDSGIKNRHLRGLPKMRRPTVVTQGNLPKGAVAGVIPTGSKSSPRVVSINAKQKEKMERVLPMRYVMAHEGVHANTKRNAYRSSVLSQGRKGTSPTTRPVQLEEARADDHAVRQTGISPFGSYKTMSQVRPFKLRHYRQHRAKLSELKENKVVKYDSPAWTRSEGKNPEGGLNAKGRASAKAQGHNLKPPVKSGDNPRRASFLARMGNMPGPERKPNGEPTRLLLSLNAWGASSKADAKKKAASISVNKGLPSIARSQYKELKASGQLVTGEKYRGAVNPDYLLGRMRLKAYGEGPGGKYHVGRSGYTRGKLKSNPTANRSAVELRDATDQRRLLRDGLIPTGTKKNKYGRVDSRMKSSSYKESGVGKSMVSPGVYKPASSLSAAERKAVKTGRNYANSRGEAAQARDIRNRRIDFSSNPSKTWGVEKPSKMRRADIERGGYIKVKRNVYVKDTKGYKHYKALKHAKMLPKMRRPTIVGESRNLPPNVGAAAANLGSKSSPRYIFIPKNGVPEELGLKRAMMHEAAHANTKRPVSRMLHMQTEQGGLPTGNAKKIQMEEARADRFAAKHGGAPKMSYRVLAAAKPIERAPYISHTYKLWAKDNPVADKAIKGSLVGAAAYGANEKINKGIRRINPGQLEIPNIGEAVQQAAKRRLPTEGRWKHLSGKTTPVRIIGKNPYAKDSFDVIDYKDTKRILPRNSIIFIKPKNVSKSMEYSVYMNQSRFGGSSAVGHNLEDVEKGLMLDKFAGTKAGKRYLKYDAHVLPKRPKRDKEGIPYVEAKYKATKEAKRDAAIAAVLAGGTGTGVALNKSYDDKPKPVWEKPNPNKESDPLSKKRKASAKARAKAAGRPYPNLIDNMAAARSSSVNKSKRTRKVLNSPETRKAFIVGRYVGRRTGFLVGLPAGAGAALGAVQANEKIEKAETMYDAMGNPVNVPQPLMSGNAKLGAAGTAIGLVGVQRVASAGTLQSRLQGQSDAMASRVKFQERLADDQIKRVQAASQIPNKFTRNKQVRMSQYYSDKAQGSLANARAKQTIADNALRAAPAKKRAHLKTGAGLIATGGSLGGLAVYNNAKDRKNKAKAK